MSVSMGIWTNKHHCGHHLVQRFTKIYRSTESWVIGPVLPQCLPITTTPPEIDIIAIRIPPNNIVDEKNIYRII